MPIHPTLLPTPSRTSYPSAPRLRGYEAAITAHHPRPIPAINAQATPSMEDGAQATPPMFLGRSPPSTRRQDRHPPLCSAIRPIAPSSPRSLRLLQVVRCFEDDDIVHVDGKVDPRSDIDVINLELIFSDLEQIEKRLDKLSKSKTKDTQVKVKEQAEKSRLEKIQQALMEGKPARSVDLAEHEKQAIKHLYLLTMKPVIYVANVTESYLAEPDINPHDKEVAKRASDLQSEHSSTYEYLLLLGASVYDDFTNEIPNADSVHAPTDYNEILSLCFIVLEGDMMVVVVLHVAFLSVVALLHVAFLSVVALVRDTCCLALTSLALFLSAVALVRDTCCLALTSLALSSPSPMALAILEGSPVTKSALSVNSSSPPPTAAGSSPVATSPECCISARQWVARCQSPLMSTPRSTAWSLRYQRDLLQIQALVLSEEAQVSRRFKSNGQILAIDEI
uniref:OBG-type G domain-containing protein n=1 Tax=Zea mays TaxID=4577 RepID=A0A804MUI6_MAIZE